MYFALGVDFIKRFWGKQRLANLCLLKGMSHTIFGRLFGAGMDKSGPKNETSYRLFFINTFKLSVYKFTVNFKPPLLL